MKKYLVLLGVCFAFCVYGAADIPLSVTTAATGTNWTALPSQACTEVTIVNTSGVDLLVDRGGAGVSGAIPNGSALKIRVNGNANELSIRRADTSNTQVTITVYAGKSSV